MIVYLNGAYLDRAAARVSVDDRGFLFGDGVYEVTRAVRGHLFAHPHHLRRLERGLHALELAWPVGLGPAELTTVSERLLLENGLADGEATVYVQITRGGEGVPRQHVFPPASTPPTVFVAASRFPSREDLRRRGAAAITEPDVRWGRCDLKTIQLLPNILAKQRAEAAGAYDALLVRDGLVTEGAQSNAFMVLDDVMRTHPPGPRVLTGVTRDVVLEIAAELGLPVREEAVHAIDLSRTSEVFFTGTTTDVMPVVQIDGRPVGTGRPGPVARQLQEKLRERLDAVTASPLA
jgi:D-alanine transaminase